MKPIETEKKKEADETMRADTFKIVVHRRKGDLHPDDIYNEPIDDRTKVHKFKVWNP